MLKNGNRAGEYFRLLNPIEHARTKENAIRYKVEPYVVSADVYSSNYLLGRGGWTWYTGSSSWLYIAGLSYILGIKKCGEKLIINPCIPNEWKEYSVIYRYKSCLYDIKIKNNSHKNFGVKTIYFDNNLIRSYEIELLDDNKTHIIEIEI